jgi:thioredoxin-related protein
MIIKLILTLVVFILVSCQEEQKNTPWTTAQEAFEKSAIDNKPVFLDAWAEWCAPCKIMDKQIYSKKKWQDYLLKNFHIAKIDVEHAEEVMCNGKYKRPYKCMENPWRIDGLPAALILDSKGKLLTHKLGAMSPSDFKIFVDDFTNGSQK